jgi:hypothetical protein
MPAKENVESVNRAIARFNAKDLEGYLEMFDKAVVFHGLSRKLKPGVGGLRDYYSVLREGFPDIRLASEDRLLPTSSPAVLTVRYPSGFNTAERSSVAIT